MKKKMKKKNDTNFFCPICGSCDGIISTNILFNTRSDDGGCEHKVKMCTTCGCEFTIWRGAKSEKNK